MVLDALHYLFAGYPNERLSIMVLPALSPVVPPSQRKNLANIDKPIITEKWPEMRAAVVRQARSMEREHRCHINRFTKYGSVFMYDLFA